MPFRRYMSEDSLYIRVSLQDICCYVQTFVRSKSALCFATTVKSLSATLWKPWPAFTSCGSTRGYLRFQLLCSFAYFFNDQLSCHFAAFYVIGSDVSYYFAFISRTVNSDYRNVLAFAASTEVEIAAESTGLMINHGTPLSKQVEISLFVLQGRFEHQRF